jgi:hypothetical protein
MHCSEKKREFDIHPGQMRYMVDEEKKKKQSVNPTGMD